MICCSLYCTINRKITFSKYNINTGKTYGEHIFCKVSMGDQEQVTDVVQTNSENGNIFHSNDSLSPYLVWNTSMQFHIKNINEDNLVIEVFEKCLFTPDGKLPEINNIHP